MVGGTRRPVALLQLTSHRGLCALIRLSNLKMIPSELKVSGFYRFQNDFLENYFILKINKNQTNYFLF